MSKNQAEIERRKTIAIAVIKSTLDTAEGEFGSTLFASHHLEEIDPKYWQAQLGTTQPSLEKIISILEFQSHWGEEEEEGIEFFDFTLPDSVTNYVLCVHFNEAGEIEQISMES